MPKLLFIIYLCYAGLLAVLLPHTAWTFAQLEPNGPIFGGLPIEYKMVLGTFAAIVFEIGTGGITHLLAHEIAKVKQRKLTLMEQFKHDFVNPPGTLLAFMVLITVLSNWTHAREYIAHSSAQTFQDDWVILAFPIVFGAALPICSVVFAYVIADQLKLYRQDKKIEKAIETEEDIVTKIIEIVSMQGQMPAPDVLAQMVGVGVEEIEKHVLIAKRHLISSFAEGNQ